MDDLSQGDICRVCRCEAQSDRPLFYPCICTGSIKYIHQDCLMQWMRYSHKEYCELCGHRFSFQPIYSPDMPRVLPLRDVVAGLLGAIAKAAKSWFHYSLVGVAWFGVVPLSAYRTYRCLFRASSLDMILSLPFDVFSTENLASDAFRGCFVVTCTLLSFIGLVWLRDQILHGGGPDWLEREEPAINANVRDNEAAAAAAAPGQGEGQGGGGLGEDGGGGREDQPPDDNAVQNPDPPNNARNRRNNNNNENQANAARNDNNNNNNDDEEEDLDHQPINNEVPILNIHGDGNVPNENIENDRLQSPNQDHAIQQEALDHNNDLANPPNLGENPLAEHGANDDQAQNLNRNHENENLDENNGEPVQNPINNEAAAEAAANEVENNADPDFNAAAADAVGGEPENDNDEPNWNPMEWDRAAEELTWERLLGLDGSLLFLEHVFWIISLNTMFIFIFAFCPYCIGNFILNWLKVLQLDKPILHFHGLITTLFGYCVIGLSLVILHYFACIFRLKRIRWLIGLCYIVVKVSLLSVVEIGVLPLVCGWWLDICSLPLFDASLKDRKVNFQAAPGTSLFVHWMFGMVYVYYFAAFISLLREVLRPGVLWIFRNVNDPDFSPLQEMIHVPILRHIRRLIASAVIFGSAVLLMLWMPIKILKTIWPTFLPYTLSGDSEVNELSLQLLLLQIILPGFFEQSHTRLWLKSLLRLWCVCVSWVLGIKSYLLGNNNNEKQENNAEEENPVERNVNDPANEEDADTDADADEEDENEANENENENNEEANVNANVNANANVNENENEAAGGANPAPAPAAVLIPPLPLQIERNLAAVHEAMRQREVIIGYQPYERPTFFPLRLFALLVIMCVTIVVASLITLTVPVWIGRQFMSFWSVGSHIAKKTAQNGADINARSHELYTAAIGTYFCWILSRGITITVTLLPQGRDAVLNKIKYWLRIGLVYAVPVLTFLLMLSIIPLLFGLLLELVVVIPLRVPFYQTPVHFLWQDWALGVLYTKISVALTMMGPDWHMKRALERAYRDGLRDINLKFLINDLALPVVTFFGLSLSIPYILAHSIVPMFVESPVLNLELSRIMYPFFFIVVGIIAYIYFEISQFKKLYVAIKVDKYLVGQRLVNYEHRRRNQGTNTDNPDGGAGGLENNNANEEGNNEEINPALIIEQDAIIRRRREAAAAAAEREALLQRLVGDGEAEVL